MHFNYVDTDLLNFIRILRFISWGYQKLELTFAHMYEPDWAHNREVVNICTTLKLIKIGIEFVYDA